jgi:hypothetical protein
LDVVFVGKGITRDVHVPIVRESWWWLLMLCDFIAGAFIEVAG